MSRARRGGRHEVVWRNAWAVLPTLAGKYVVEVECAGEMSYLSTRTFNPDKGWMDSSSCEVITHWLDELLSVTELKARGML